LKIEKNTGKEANNLNRKFILLFCVVAFIIPLCYIFYTGHIWEDFFITFKFSRNLAEGNGLVYEPGIRVHGFTSPFGVLLPALCYLISTDKTYFGTIWIFRILFCLPAFISGGVCIIKTFLGPEKNSNLKYSMIPALFAALFYLFETKSVIFSVNGMETAFMLMFFAWAFYLMQYGIEKKWLLTGIAWGGLMWSRPDSCIYVAALMLTTFIFAEKRQRAVIGIIKAALLTTAVYLPWFIWAWLYYGTPVPHTVTAKGSQLFNNGITGFLSRWYEHTSWVFAPVYPHFGGWPQIVAIFATALSIFCFLYWMLPWTKTSENENTEENSRLEKIAKTASFLFFILSLYLGFMTFPYPWYFPPVAMIGIMAIVAGTFQLFHRLKDPVRRIRYPIFINTIILLLFIFILIMTSFQMRIQQNIIENNTRTVIGKWLKKNIRRDDRIFLECLGYIGYFSEGKMLDYPGLCTPEVVALLKDKQLNRATVIPELKPEWLVLRPAEVQEICQMPFFKRDYIIVKEFDSQGALKKMNYIPGRNYLMYDSYFYVMKRKEKEFSH